jgi:hypothetical protein
MPARGIMLFKCFSTTSFSSVKPENAKPQEQKHVARS